MGLHVAIGIYVSCFGTKGVYRILMSLLDSYWDVDVYNKKIDCLYFDTLNMTINLFPRYQAFQVGYP